MLKNDIENLKKNILKAFVRDSWYQDATVRKPTKTLEAQSLCYGVVPYQGFDGQVIYVDVYKTFIVYFHMHHH